MINAQRTARKALLPLLCVALNNSPLQAAGLFPASKDTAPDGVDSSRARLIALSLAEGGMTAGNLTVVAQYRASLSGDNNPIGNNAALSLRSGRARDASIVQHCNHNQKLIVQSALQLRPL